MVILLILVQVALAILDLLAHVINVNLWLVFLPGIFLAVLYFLAVVVLRGSLMVNTINPIGRR